ncbi:unnamed protein product [Zymoseptoria tritici ST99CH_1A5]|uniref:FAM192A/Fyv6 N-terminal domain-containing protein n=1 Tax=Zymoseptoria tritici ST99CH_1A5 TaxID=1276529 RepID=A0A1Y6LBD2_ZYMTR|nr:unnamed protein product [Zymoseptoria tritici ST99CH_3D1]SMY19841.1 unnamed protein product [Zymoseptoria tritici ST99CH_1A5]
MSRFVSGGTNEEPTERDEAWLKAQSELDARRAEKAAQAQANSGKSLFETLEANKAAKQDAFEESIKLRNQFQALDEDDVEFLDSVLESTRKQEAAVRKQTREELEAFKRQQQEAEQAAKVVDTLPEAPVETSSWTVSRKRKKGREDVLGGVKLRKASSGAKTLGEAAKDESPVSGTATGAAEPAGKTALADVGASKNANSGSSEVKEVSNAPAAIPRPSVSPPPQPGSGLGLVAYSSDEDD